MGRNNLIYGGAEMIYSRRGFIKMVGLAGALFASQKITGCTSFRESRHEVSSIPWKCNPILPIPKDGCYVGTNLQGNSSTIGTLFKEKFGISPTLHAVGFGKAAATNEVFPRTWCQIAIDSGIIPTIRYATAPFMGYKPILRGEYDDDFREFARQVAEFGYPIVFIPFQQCNITNSRHYKWAGYPGEEYKAAMVRIHTLFGKEGANKNTIWTTKFNVGPWYNDPFEYCPPRENIDIIGWALHGFDRPDIGITFRTFETLFGHFYEKAAEKYSDKPQMFWEVSTHKDFKQASWINRAFDDIKDKFPRVKGVMLDEAPFTDHGDRFGSYDPTLTEESIAVVKRHFSTDYFIGSIIKKPG